MIDYSALPGASNWSDGIGDSKCAVLVRYRIHVLTEAIQQDEVDRHKPLSKGRKR